MKLFNALVTGQAALMNSAVLGLEAAAIQLPDGLEAFDDATFAEHVASYEQHMADYHTLQGRISSLEDMLETIGTGKDISPQQAALIESTVEKAVDGTDIDAAVDVVPGLESVLTNPNYVLSTEGIKDTISKLVAGAKSVFKKALASLGKILGSIRAKGYLITERLKDAMEDVKGNDVSTEANSFELKGLARLLTADDNVPNDAPELIKFLDRHIAMAKAITVDSLKAEAKASTKVRKFYGQVIDSKLTAREVTVQIGKVAAELIDSFPKILTAATYKGNLFDFGTTRSEMLGGEQAIISNYDAVSKKIKSLKTDDTGNSTAFASAVQGAHSRVDTVKSPGDFKSSKVKPMTKAEFSKVADKILELVNTIKLAYEWPEEYEKEWEFIWDLHTEYSNNEGKNSDAAMDLLYKTTNATLSLRVPYYRAVLVRLMTNADNASMLVKKMADAQIKHAIVLKNTDR